MRKIQKLKNGQIHDLEEFIRDKESNKKEIRRAQAILILCNGGSESLISSLTGFKKKYVFKLRNKYLEKGLAGLKTKKRKHRDLLTKRQIKEVIETLEIHKSSEFGSNASFWSTFLLAQFYEGQFGSR